MKREPYFDAPGISSHKLGDFRTRGPAYFYAKHVQKVVPDEDSATFSFGRAVHCLTLEGEAKFSASYIECPAEHRTPSGEVSTKKATKDWLASIDRGVLSEGEAADARLMAKRVREHAYARILLLAGKPEVEKFATHVRTGLPLKGKADWCCADGTGFDLKTCWSIDEFPADAAKYGYAGQLAFYRSLFGWTDAYLVAVEKTFPYRVRVYRVSRVSLDAAASRNEAALDDLARCYERDEWNDSADVFELVLL